MCSYRSKLNNENILVTHSNVVYFIPIDIIMYTKRNPKTQHPDRE